MGKVRSVAFPASSLLGVRLLRQQRPVSHMAFDGTTCSLELIMSRYIDCKHQNVVGTTSIVLLPLILHTHTFTCTQRDLKRSKQPQKNIYCTKRSVVLRFFFLFCVFHSKAEKIIKAPYGGKDISVSVSCNDDKAAKFLRTN